MVLVHVRGWDNIPKDVRLLSEQEALKHQHKLINKWKKPSEVFFLKNGSTIVGLVTSLASLPIIQHFRKQFKLNEIGRVVTYAPATIMPSLLTYIGYQKLVTSDIILMKMRCPLCMQFRYTAYHLCTSLIYTTAITTLTCSSVAFARKTRYVPPPQTQGKLFIRVVWDVIKAGARKYQATTAFQLVIILFLPYLQVKEFNKLMESASENEKMGFDSENSISSENVLQTHLQV